MITLTEDRYAKALRKAAEVERARARKRDTPSGWRTTTNFPGQHRQPRRTSPLKKTILKALAGGPMTTGEIAEAANRVNSGVTSTLKGMFDMGLIDREPRGKTYLYSLRPEAEKGEGG